MIRFAHPAETGKHMGDPGVMGSDGSTAGDRRHSPTMYLPKHRAPLTYREVFLRSLVQRTVEEGEDQ